MTSAILRASIAILVALALLSTPRFASADTKRGGVIVGVEPALDLQIARLHASSPEHPWGTAAVVWRADDASVARLWVGEWDLLAGRFVKQRRLREADGPDSAVRVERAGDSLLILVSGFQSASRTELIRVDLDLVEQGSVSLAEGFLGSLVIGEGVVAAATYEGASYHLRLVDLATLVVVAARKLTGPFSPWPAPERSAHALRLEGGRLYVALAERDPRFVKLRLPSLAVETSMTFTVPVAHRWAYTSAALSAPPDPLSFDTGNDRYLISRDLRLLAPLPTTTAPIEDEASSSVMGERVTQRMFGRTVSTAVRQGQWIMRVR